MTPVGSRCQPRGQRTQPPPLASRVWGLGVSRFKGLGLRSLLGPKSGATRLSFRPDAVSAESDLRLKQSQDLFALRIGALQEALGPRLACPASPPGSWPLEPASTSKRPGTPCATHGDGAAADPNF